MFLPGARTYRPPKGPPRNRPRARRNDRDVASRHVAETLPGGTRGGAGDQTSGRTRSSSRLNARVEVCGGERAPRPEAFPELVDLLDRRRRIEPPDTLDRAAEREVSRWPDIGPAQREHQHSIGGEPTDALDLGKCAPGAVVVEGEQAIEVKPSVLEPCGEIVQVDRLGSGHPDTAEGFGVGGAELGRCGHPAAPEAPRAG